jgi:hypothetical protein
MLKYLCIARPRYRQLVLSIETLLDVSTLSIEEITGRLKVVEDDVVESPAVEGKLLLTEEEWRERAKKKDTGDASRGGSNGDRGGRGRGGGNRGRGRGRGGRGDSSGSSGGRGNNGNCHRCGKPGHWAHDCRSKQPMKKEEQAYTAQEEEPSLLFAEIESISGNSGEDGHRGDAGGLKGEHAAGQVQDPVSMCAPAGAPFKAAAAAGEKSSIVGVPGGGRKVHIVEEKVFTALSDEGGKDPRQWVLDTGASNHMTGSRAAFASIDVGTTGTVNFGDRSVV